MEKGDVEIYCGYDHIKKLRRNLQNENNFHWTIDANGKFSMELPGTGTMIHSLPGLTNQHFIVAGRRSNFYIGADLKSDDEQFKLWYSEDDDKLKIRSKFRQGVQFAFGSELTVWNEALS
jgi:hypothetical protein